ncbi:MAG: substrate-binding domain-containing protein [Cyanobacteria bacterium J06631_12]
MSQSKNEVPALIATLVVTAAIVGGAVWWLKDRVSFGPSARSEISEQTASGRANGSQPAFAAVENIPSGQFFYGGSTTWAPIRGILLPQIRQAWPSFFLEYKEDPARAAGSTVGIQMLMAGDLNFAQSSRPLTEAEEQQAAQQGIALEALPVALEAVAIATHPDLPIPGLTLTQLKDIYLGSLTNWQQVGGPNLAIVPVSRGTEGGTVQFFQERVLGGQDLSPSVQMSNSTTAALRLVGETPGAVYFASAPEVVGQCTIAPLPIGVSPRQLVAPYQAPYVPPEECPAKRNRIDLGVFQRQDYPLTRPLYVVIRKDSQAAEQAGLAYAQIFKTEEGKRILNQAGFVALP